MGCLTPDLLRRVQPTTVALFLGTSPLRPKEIFSFVLTDLEGEYPPQGTGAGAEKLVANAARRCIRQCLPVVASSTPPTVGR